MFPFPSYLPSALILINNDLTDQVVEFTSKQLFLTQILDGYGFENVLSSDPEFIANIKRKNERVAILASHQEFRDNRDMFDLVLFFKNGLASVEQNKFGPPCFTFPITKLYWGILGVY